MIKIRATTLGIVSLVVLFLEVFVVVVGISTADTTVKVGSIADFGLAFVILTVIVIVLALAAVAGSSQKEEKDSTFDKNKNEESTEEITLGDDGELVSKPIPTVKTGSKSEGG